MPDAKPKLFPTNGERLVKIRIATTPPASAYSEEEFPGYLAECEKLGFDTLWLSDIPLGPLGDPILSLAYAASATSHLKLGANVVPLGRNPLWLAKQLAQLDRLSQGRLLLSFVPGIGQPAERAALGYVRGHRGRAVDEMIGLLRRWWAGEEITTEFSGFSFQGVSVRPQPIQDPLEIWLGGKAPDALARVGALADGWLTSAMTPLEASAGREVIEKEAARLGRTIDPEHFGISIPYARELPDEVHLAPLRKRREDADLSQVLALGETHLAELIGAHIDGGLSKFVLRPAATLDPGVHWRDELRWLADSTLKLQT